jgi:hypothetical protein
MHLVGVWGGFYKLPHIASFGLVGGCGRRASCTVTHCPPSPPLIITVMPQRCANACMTHAFAVGWARASEAMCACMGGWGKWLHHTHLVRGLGEAYTQNATHCLLEFAGCGEVCFMYSDPPPPPPHPHPHPPNAGDATVMPHNARLCMCVVVSTTWWSCGARCWGRVTWVSGWPLLLHSPHSRQLCHLRNILCCLC